MTLMRSRPDNTINNDATLRGLTAGIRLAELRNTEVIKGMSEEQILAMAAQKSCAVADAIKEKFRSMGSERIEEMYKKMLEDKSGFAEQLKSMFSTALDTQSGASVGVAHGAGPKPAGYMGVVGGSKPAAAGGAVLLCSKCNPPSYNYYGNCGQKLKGI